MAQRSPLMLGESLVGDGNEVAHIDLMVGPKDGPAGHAFATALSSQREGHSTLLAVVAPNLPCKPDTILFNKVTIKGAKQAVQMFGPAQAAVARAVADSVEAGIVPGDDNLCILVGVFIHWDAEDDQKIYRYNYQATREALQRAVRGEPRAETVTSQKRQARHPFASGSEDKLEDAEFQTTSRERR